MTRCLNVEGETIWKEKKGDQFHRVHHLKKKNNNKNTFAFDGFIIFSSHGRGSLFDIIKLMDEFLITLAALCIFYVVL
jgi:hypothetical protein